MKKLSWIFFIFFSITLSHYSFSQDTLNNTSADKKLVVSFYLDPIIIYEEPGIQFQYFFKKDHFKDHYWGLKYGFVFFQYNFNSGTSGFLDLPHTEKENFSGYGSIVKFSYGYLNNVFFTSSGEREKDCTHEYRVIYKDLFFPEYDDTESNDPSSSYALWFRQSERRRVIVLNYIFGKQIYKEGNFRIDFNMILGWAYGKRYLNRHPPTVYINQNPHVEASHLTKTITRPSLGVEFIFRYKTYEKNFKP